MPPSNRWYPYTGNITSLNKKNHWCIEEVEDKYEKNLLSQFVVSQINNA